jgi:hypothetical protein
MTRKDYERLAAAILQARNQCASRSQIEGVGWAVACITQTLAEENPRFNAARFFQAAGFSNLSEDS